MPLVQIQINKEVNKKLVRYRKTLLKNSHDYFKTVYFGHGFAAKPYPKYTVAFTRVVSTRLY